MSAFRLAGFTAGGDLHPALKLLGIQFAVSIAPACGRVNKVSRKT